MFVPLKDPILRLDTKTHQVIQSWSLTHLHRWGASSSMFTLDFGDYAESYYSVQTTETEELAFMISKYIELNVKYKQQHDELEDEIEEDEDVVDSVRPTGAVMSPLPVTSSSIVIPEENEYLYAEAHRIQKLIQEIASAPSANACAESLSSCDETRKANSIPATTTSVEFVRQISADCARICVAYPNSARVHSELSNLSITLLNAEMSDQNVILAARGLCRAISDLVDTVCAGSATTATPQTQHKSAFDHATHVATECSNQINRLTRQRSDVLHKHDKLVAESRSVAQATADLVLNAKSLPELVSDATACTLAVSRLLACAKLAAISKPRANDMVGECCERVMRCCQRLCHTASKGDQIACFEQEMQAVEDKIDSLKCTLAWQTSAGVVDDILQCLQTVKSSQRIEDSTKLRQLTARFVLSLRQRAKISSGKRCDDILADARLLGETINQLSNGIVKQRDTCDIQRRCDTFRFAVLRASLWLQDSGDDQIETGDTSTGSWISQMHSACREAVSSCIRLISLIQRHEPVNETRPLTNMIPVLVAHMKSCVADPKDVEAQDILLTAVKDFIELAESLYRLASTKRTGVLADDLQSHVTEMGKIREAVISDFHGNFVSETVDMIGRMCADLDRGLTHIQIEAGSDLDPDEAYRCFIKAFAFVRTRVNYCLESFEKLPMASIAYLSDALTLLYDSVVRIHASDVCVLDRTTMEFICQRTSDALHSIQDLVTQLATNSEMTKSFQSLDEQVLSEAMDDCVAMLPGHRELFSAINKLNQSVAEHHRAAAAALATTGCAMSETLHISSILVNLNKNVNAFNVAVYQLASCIDSATPLLVDRVTESFDQMIGCALAACESRLFAPRNHKLSFQVHTIHSCALAMLDNARAVYVARILQADQEEPSCSPVRICNLVSNEVKPVIPYCVQLTERLNELVSMAATANADVPICEYALDRLKHARQAVCRKPGTMGPTNNMTFTQAFDRVSKDGSDLGRALKFLLTVTKEQRKDCELRTTYIAQAVSDAACGLVEAASQIAYLIAAHQDGCVRGEPGLVDQFTFHKCELIIERTCHRLFDCENVEDVEDLLLTVAEFVCIICNAARRSAARTWTCSNDSSASKFLACSEDLSNVSYRLINETVQVINAGNGSCFERMQGCRQISARLLQSTSVLCSYAASKKFAAIPATISEKGVEIQKAMIDSVGVLVDGTSALIEGLIKCDEEDRDADKNGKQITSLDSREIWPELSASTRQISSGIASLIATITSSASHLVAQKLTLNTLHNLSDGQSIETIQEDNDELNLLNEINSLKLTDLREVSSLPPETLLDRILYTSLHMFEYINRLLSPSSAEFSLTGVMAASGSSAIVESISALHYAYMTSLKNILRASLSLDSQIGCSRDVRPSPIVVQAESVLKSGYEFITTAFEEDSCEDRSKLGRVHTKAIEDLVSVVQEQYDQCKAKRKPVISQHNTALPPTRAVFPPIIVPTTRRYLHLSEDSSDELNDGGDDHGTDVCHSLRKDTPKLHEREIAASAGVQVDSCSQDVNNVLSDILINLD
ncbi:hypothetical protein ACOME3_002480 [Neoechinorhynchus agilis]